MTRAHRLFLVVAIILVASSGAAIAQTTAFTYQGSLQVSGSPANGNFDLQFALFDASSGGSQLGSTITVSNVAVTNGIFTASLDFGNQFPGASRYLEISVRSIGGGAFTTLTPRQQVGSAPYSVKSLNTDTATNATQLGGFAANQYVLTGDPRMTDPRPPTAGSSNYIQNQNAAPQSSSNFNISGAGAADVFSAGTQFNIGANRILASPGTDNLFVGRSAGATNSTGIQNSFLGKDAGLNNSSGNFNSFFGVAAGRSNTNGSDNTFVGLAAGRENSTGNGNSFVGNEAGRFSSTGSFNTFFGVFAGDNNLTGAGNTIVGYFAGRQNVSGSSNSALGYFADFQTGATLTNATAIGARAQVSQSNSIVLGAINGVNGATADTSVGIGTTAPTERLHVVGNGLFTGNLTVNGSLNVPSLAGQFIQNTTSQQANSNFSISGNGFVNGSGGVGTTSDTFLGSPARFTVVQQQSGQWASHIGTNNFAAGNSFGLLVDAGTNSADDALRIRNQSGAGQLVSVKGNGFVGFGTSNPTSHLHLLANAPQGFAIQMENTSTSKKLFIGNYGTIGAGNHWPGLDSANTSFLYAENPLVFTTPGGIYFSGSTSAEHMRIASNGTVSIAGSLIVGGGNATIPATGQSSFSGVQIGAGGLQIINLSGGAGGSTLCGAGSAPFTIGFCSSSYRYKTNVAPYHSGMDLVHQLQPITFDWKKDGSRDLGLGAEDVEKVDPKLVFYKDGQVEGVRYEKLGVVLINAVKEQQAQIETQQRQIERQQAEIGELKKLVCKRNRKAAVCKAH